MSVPNEDFVEMTDNTVNRNRQSILKTAKSPNRFALKDLDINLHTEEITKSSRYSRRVSFADKYQVKEFYNDSVTSWNCTELRPISGSDESSSTSSASSLERTNSKSQIQGLDTLLSGKIQNETDVFQNDATCDHLKPSEQVCRNQKLASVSDMNDDVFVKPKSCKNVDTYDTIDMSFTQAFGNIIPGEKISSNFILSAFSNDFKTMNLEPSFKRKKPTGNEIDKENVCFVNVTDEDTTTEMSHDNMVISKRFKSGDCSDMEMTEVCTVNISVNQIRFNECASVQKPEVCRAQENKNEKEEENVTKSVVSVRKSIGSDDMEMTECLTVPINLNNVTYELKKDEEEEQKKKRKSILYDDLEMEITECLTSVIDVNDINNIISEVKKDENENKTDRRKSVLSDDMDMTECLSGYIDLNNIDSEGKKIEETTEREANYNSGNQNITKKNVTSDNMELTDCISGLIDENDIENDDKRNETNTEKNDTEITETLQKEIYENSSFFKPRSENSNMSSLNITYESTGQITRELTAQLLRDAARTLKQNVEVKVDGKSDGHSSDEDSNKESFRFSTGNNPSAMTFPNPDELLQKLLRNQPKKISKLLKNEKQLPLSTFIVTNNSGNLKKNCEKLDRETSSESCVSFKNVEENNEFPIKAPTSYESIHKLSTTNESLSQHSEEKSTLGDQQEILITNNAASVNISNSFSNEMVEKSLQNTQSPLCALIKPRVKEIVHKEKDKTHAESCEALKAANLNKSPEKLHFANEFLERENTTTSFPIMREKTIFDEECPNFSFLSPHDTTSKSKTYSRDYSVLSESIECLRSGEDKSILSVENNQSGMEPAFKKPPRKCKKTTSKARGENVPQTPQNNPHSTMKKEMILITPQQKANISQTSSLLKNVKFSCQKLNKATVSSKDRSTLLGNSFTTSFEVSIKNNENDDDKQEEKRVGKKLKFVDEREEGPFEEFQRKLIDSKEKEEKIYEENENDNDNEIEHLYELIKMSEKMLESANKADALLNEMMEKYSVVEDVERFEKLNVEIADKEKKLKEKREKRDEELKSLNILQQEKLRLSAEVESVSKLKIEEERKLRDLELEALRLQEKAEITWNFLEGHPEQFEENGVCLSYLWRSLKLEVVYGEPIPAPSCLESLPAFNVASIKLVPSIGPPTSLTQLSHWLVLEGLKDKNFLQMSPNTFELYKVLNAVSTVVTHTRWLVEDIKSIESKHKVEIQHNIIKVGFFTCRAFAKFDLSITIQPNCYPFNPLRATFHLHFGNVTEESILAVVNVVKPGAHYLLKIINAVDSFLSN